MASCEVTARYLLVFSRYPVPGACKTRLIPQMGPAAAARLQRGMTEAVITQARAYRKEEEENGGQVYIIVFYHGCSATQMAHWLGEDLLYAPQCPGSLAEKLRKAFTHCYTMPRDNQVGARGAQVLVVGGDIPGITVHHIREAFDHLSEATEDVVIGPTFDGGYYMAGMQQQCLVDHVFSDEVRMSTEHTLQDTMKGVEKTKLASNVHLLQRLRDVDHYEDIIAIEEDAFSRSDFRVRRLIRPTITVVMPVLNEVRGIEMALTQLSACEQSRGKVELVVVDGMSTDGTWELLQELQAKFSVKECGESQSKSAPSNISANRATQCTCWECGCAKSRGGFLNIHLVREQRTGRGLQMRAGAAVASSNLFLFLHADTRVPDNYVRILEDAITTPAVAAGAFQFALEGDGERARRGVDLDWKLQMLERGVEWRCRWLGMPYGDQGMFITRYSYEMVGGYDPIPLMEDVSMVKKLRRHGLAMHILPHPIYSSNRRWERDGFWTNTVRNLFILFAFLMGVSAVTLYRMYYGRDPVQHRDALK